jgi:hypothetical protein
MQFNSSTREVPEYPKQIAAESRREAEGDILK